MADHSLSDYIIPSEDVSLKQNNENKLGQGHFGGVFKGQYKGQTVAVKCLLDVPDCGLSAKETENFIREAKIMSQLDHQNVVKMYGVVIDPSKLLYGIVMEHVGNGSLSTFLKLVEAPFELRLSIIRDVLRGLCWLHTPTSDRPQTYPHGDIKACNILLDTDFHAKISDFGGARVKRGTTCDAQSTTWKLQFTPHYLAPELCDVEDQDVRTDEKTDVWAFGITLFEILTRGKLPFPEKIQLVQILFRVGVQKKTPTDDAQLKKLPENCPKVLTDLLKSCCQIDPEQRPKFKDLYDIIEQEYTNLPETKIKDILEEMQSEYCIKYMDHNSFFYDSSTLSKMDTAENEGNRKILRKQEICYELAVEKKQFAMVINNSNFSNHPSRPASELDTMRFCEIFEHLNFNVTKLIDLTTADMYRQLQDFALHCQENEVSAVFVAIMSHGNNKGIMGIDGEILSTDHVLNIFDNRSRNPLFLANIPKIFFIQACRGKNRDLGLNEREYNPPSEPTSPLVQPIPMHMFFSDSAQDSETKQIIKYQSDAATSDQYVLSVQERNIFQVPRRADILVYNATVQGFVSWRNTTTGSWYVRALHEVFMEKAKSHHLLDILTDVSRTLAEYRSNSGHSQMPEMVSTLRKKLYFDVRERKESDRPIPSQKDSSKLCLQDEKETQNKSETSSTESQSEFSFQEEFKELFKMFNEKEQEEVDNIEMEYKSYLQQNNLQHQKEILTNFAIDYFKNRNALGVDQTCSTSGKLLLQT